MKLDDTGLPELKESGFGVSGFVSILFHIFVFIVIPLLAKFFYREPKYDVPPTFQLMAIPTETNEMSTEIPTSEPEQQEVVEEPVPEPIPVPQEVVSIKKPEKKEEPKKEEPKPKKETPKKVEPPKDEKPKLTKQQVLSELDELLGGPPKKGGASSSGSAAEKSYEGEIVRRIEENWKPSVSDKSLYVIVQYSIARNGTLQFTKKIKGSGNALLDVQAVRAVEMAFPMPPVPDEIPVPFVKTYKLDVKNK